MNKQTFAALLAGAMVLSSAGSALALDAWRDRKGLFYGVGIGGGSGKVDTAGSDAHIGYNLRARVGGGVNAKLTVDGELALHNESYDIDAGLGGSVDMTLSLTTGMVGVNYFVADGFYVRGMGGLAQLSVESDVSGSDGDDETGTGFGFGAGFEFFANADLAVGVGGDYQVLMFDDYDFTLINFGITATWY